MDLSKLFNLSYLLAKYPTDGFSWPIRIGLLIIFLGVIIISIYAGKKLKHASGPSKKLWSKLQLWGWTIGPIGLLLFYFREVSALYLSARMWMLLWLIIMIVWLIFIIKYWKKEIPRKEERLKTQAEFNRWLPRKK